MTDEEDHEISGEFGDNTAAMPARVENLEVEYPAPPLPPEEEPPATFSDYLDIFKAHHMKALIWKNFLWMSRNFG